MKLAIFVNQTRASVKFEVGCTVATNRDLCCEII